MSRVGFEKLDRAITAQRYMEEIGKKGRSIVTLSASEVIPLTQDTVDAVRTIMATRPVGVPALLKNSMGFFLF
jgi:hypothetical protein